MLRSSGRQRRPDSRGRRAAALPGRPGRRGCRPGSGRAACPAPARAACTWSTGALPSALRTSCISRASRPQEASRRLAASPAVGSPARRAGPRPLGRSPPPPDPTAPARGAAGRGGGRGRRPARAGPPGGRRAAGSARTARGAPGRSSDLRLARLRRSRAAAEPLGRDRRRRSGRAAAATARPARRSRAAGRPGGVGVAARPPGREHLRAVERVAVKQPGEMAQRGQPAAVADRVRRIRRRRRGRRRARPATALRATRSTTSSSGHTDALRQPGVRLRVDARRPWRRRR